MQYFHFVTFFYSLSYFNPTIVCQYFPPLKPLLNILFGLIADNETYSPKEDLLMILNLDSFLNFFLHN